MRTIALLAVLTAGRSAAADPECLDYAQATLHAKDGRAVACILDNHACSLFADATAKPVTVERPSEAKPAAWPFQTVNGKLSVCVDKRCVALLPKLAAVVGSIKPDAQTAAVTRDLARVVVAAQLWSVANDTMLTLSAPPKADSPHGIPFVVGNLVIASWRNCPDDFNCNGKDTVVDLDGKNVGAAFPDGRIVELDAHHAAIVGTANKQLTTLDLDTGKQIGHVTVVDRGMLEAFAVAKLDDTAVGVLWRVIGSRSWKLAWVSVPQAKSPTVTATRLIPSCPP